MPTGNGNIKPERDWDIVRRIIVPNNESYPAWCHINKCGTTTMASGMRLLPGGLNSFFGHDYPIEREVVCMWRNPWERIESTYRMYTQRAVHGYQHYTFEEFIHQCCRRKDLKDPHMLPMYEVATNRYGRFVPDRVLFWDWPAVEAIYGIRLEAKNHTPGDPQEWTPALRSEFSRRYANDLRVWYNQKVS
jgi:hypothetical protein